MFATAAVPLYAGSCAAVPVLHWEPAIMRSTARPRHVPRRRLPSQLSSHTSCLRPARGNKASLWDGPVKEGVAVRERLMAYYR